MTQERERQDDDMGVFLNKHANMPQMTDICCVSFVAKRFTFCAFTCRIL